MESRLPEVIDDAVLDRYLAGESTPAECERVEHWLSERPGGGRNVKAWQAVWSGEVVPDVAGERIWAGIKPMERSFAPRMRTYFRYIGIAAAIIIAIVGIKYIPNVNTQLPQSKTYTTTRGQRATVTLADGSQVTLAPATTIKVYGRNVELNGEAVFAVINHTGAPFTVTTGNFTTRVLGTTFGIRAYDDHIRIAVADGKISISSTSGRPNGALPGNPGHRPGSDAGHVMIPGDVAEISNSRTTIHRNVDVTSMLTWTTGRLVLSDVPVFTALAELSRWYDMDFRASSPELLRRQVTLTVEGPVTNDVLQAVANVLDARLERSGRTVTFVPNSRSNQ